MTQQTFYFPLEGGLDLSTPAQRIHPGRAIGAKNYEPSDEGGYRRILGYERFDGQPSPSEVSYYILNYDQGTGTELVAGDVITGGTSGATAEILSIDTDSGTWGVDAAGEMRLFNVVGTFEDNEALQISAVTRATADGIATARGAATDALDQTYQSAAIEARRDDIGKVPGGDEINGVWLYNGTVYVIRDAIGTTSVTDTTISFTSPDTIADSNSGFGSINVNDRILVSGSGESGNNQEWTVDTASASTLTVSRTDGDTITTESAGASVTVGVMDIAKMHKSTTSGWSEVDLGQYLDFSAGTAEFNEGATVTGSPSSATATIVGVGVTSGSWAGNDAAGRLYVKSVSGTFTASDTLADNGSTPGAANCDSAATNTTLPTGGKYEFQNYNFFGNQSTLSMWGVNGVGRGFRYNDTDGFSFVHVTGLSDSTDTPEHLEAHKKHLFFSFGSSLQFSSLGLPMVWSALTGASQISTGDQITGIESQRSDILGIFNRNRTYMLYGNDSSDWNLRDYSLERGAIEWSIQDMGVSVYADDRGIHKIGATDAHGDLMEDSLSEIIDPLFQEAKSLIVDSVRLRAKNQYRTFNSDNSGIIMRIEGNIQQFMPFEFDHRVYSVCAEEDSDGIERSFFGSDSGYVYEMEKGQSFDGQAIDHNLRLAYCHCKSPRQKKRFHKATVQIDSPDDPGLTYAPDYSFGGEDLPVAQSADSITTVGGVWGIDLWSSFTWDGALVGEAEAYIRGVGINVSLLIQGSTSYERVHTIEGVTYNYSMRGLKR